MTPTEPGTSQPASAPTDVGPLIPCRLRTEREDAPRCVDDPTPLLSWQLRGAGRSRAQGGYQIRVVAAPPGSSADAALPAVWDSGLVHGEQTSDIVYGGAPLSPRSTYRWRVRVADEQGQLSPWSAPADFATGMLGSQDWDASWIGSALDTGRDSVPSLDMIAPRQHISRVWFPGGRPGLSHAFFRKHFTLPGGARPRTWRLTVAGAEEAVAWVNGVPMPIGEAPLPDGSASPGRNVIALRVAGLARIGGIVARLDIGFADGSTVTLATDGSWRISGQEEPGWEQPGHDDLTWPLAEVHGLHGAPPDGREPASFRPTPYLRREFEVRPGMLRARLYATALGVYEVRCNGQRADMQRLAPGWTDYDTRIAYQCHDVTGLLLPGRNAIGVVLGDGWYSGHVARFCPYQYGAERRFLGRLEIEYPGGETDLIVTDGTWRAATGGTRYADLQNGEVFDARDEPDGWDQPYFADDAWSPVTVPPPPRVRIDAEIAPPIVVTEELKPTIVTALPGQRYLVDFGQNLVGWLALRATGPAGAHIVIQHAEVLDDAGELYTAPLRGARATDEWFLAGVPDESFEPRFTVHGFRYAAISGYPGELTASDVVARVAHAAMRPTGTFECSDPRLTQLHRNISWSQRGNFLTVPTDCPQRDERMGWTGDAQVFAATAAFGYDVRSFFRKWLRDVRDAQLSDGAVTDVAPDVLSRNPGPVAAGTAGWGDAIVIVPYQLWWAYRDRRLLAECYDAIAAWLGFLGRTSSGHLRPATGYGDWLALAETPSDLVQTAFYAYAAQLATRIAAELGAGDDARRWKELYRDVRAAFRDAFVRGGGQLTAPTQAGYVLALSFKLFDEAEREAAAGRLTADIAGRGWHLTTGFLATPFLLPVLSAAGRDDVAFRLLTQDSYPSWLYPVVHGGATTIWERWDSWSDSRGFQDPSMTSFNHYAYGAVGEWLYRAVGGIEAATPGYAEVLVAPRIGYGGITAAAARLETVHGEVGVQWRIDSRGLDGDMAHLDVELPPNATALVRLPAGPRSVVTEDGRPIASSPGVLLGQDAAGMIARIGSGQYRFAVTSPLRPPDG